VTKFKDIKSIFLGQPAWEHCFFLILAKPKRAKLCLEKGRNYVSSFKDYLHYNEYAARFNFAKGFLFLFAQSKRKLLHNIAEQLFLGITNKAICRLLLLIHPTSRIERK